MKKLPAVVLTAAVLAAEFHHANEGGWDQLHVHSGEIELIEQSAGGQATEAIIEDQSFLLKQGGGYLLTGSGGRILLQSSS